MIRKLIEALARRWVSSLALALGAVLLWSGTASANHNEVEEIISIEGCQVTGETSWTQEDHLVDNAVLVVLVNEGISTAPVGDPLEVELDPGTETVQWRIWGGGERDYDRPALSDLDELVTYLEDDPDHSPVDLDAPGVEWFSTEVTGCDPEPTPTETTPGPDPTETASPSPTPEQTPSASPGNEQTLPETSGISLLPTLAIGGAAALLVGGGLVALMNWMGRRRAEYEDELGQIPGDESR